MSKVIGIRPLYDQSTHELKCYVFSCVRDYSSESGGVGQYCIQKPIFVNQQKYEKLKEINHLKSMADFIGKDSNEILL